MRRDAQRARLPLVLDVADTVLIRRLRAGDRAAFAEIHRRYRQELERHAARLLGPRVTGAEDVVQEVFARAHRALLADGRDVVLRPWLHTLVRNRCLDELRRPVPPIADEEAARDRPSPFGDPAGTIGRREELRAVVADVIALPDRQRDVLVRHELQGVPHSQLAADLGITVAGSKSLANRARETLRRSALARAA
jgi:RNA polymerase sigma-70 factor (ECF subfamily)